MLIRGKYSGQGCVRRGLHIHGAGLSKLGTSQRNLINLSCNGERKDKFYLSQLSESPPNEFSSMSCRTKSERKKKKCGNEK